MLKRREKMMLDYYEETLKELEEIEMNLDDLSRNELHFVLRTIVNRGWLQVETMFGQHKSKKHTKEEIQQHFDQMLKVVPMTKVKRINDKT
jgi:hypothetical protein